MAKHRYDSREEIHRDGDNLIERDQSADEEETHHDGRDHHHHEEFEERQLELFPEELVRLFSVFVGTLDVTAGVSAVAHEATSLALELSPTHNSEYW